MKLDTDYRILSFNVDRDKLENLILCNRIQYIQNNITQESRIEIRYSFQSYRIMIILLDILLYDFNIHKQLVTSLLLIYMLTVAHLGLCLERGRMYLSRAQWLNIEVSLVKLYYYWG